MATLTDKALIQQVVVTKIKDLVVTLLNLEKRLFGATYRERVIEYKAKGVQIPDIKNKLRFMLTGLHFDEINSEHLLLLDLGFRLFEFMCELYDDDDDDDEAAAAPELIALGGSGLALPPCSRFDTLLLFTL